MYDVKSSKKINTIGAMKSFKKSRCVLWTEEQLTNIRIYEPKVTVKREIWYIQELITYNTVHLSKIWY